MTTSSSHPFRTVAAAAVLAAAAFGAAAQPAMTCDGKRDVITREIGEARAASQTQRVKGLERALRQLNKNCTDDKLKAAEEAAVKKQKTKVAQRQRDLAKAEKKGDARKIEGRKEKLAEEEAELARLLRDGTR